MSTWQVADEKIRDRRPSNGSSFSYHCLRIQIEEKTMKKRLLVACLVTIGVLTVAFPAFAQPPTKSQFSIDLSGPHFLSGFCGFEILHEGTLEVSSTDYPDGRVIEHIRVDAVLTANGRSASENARFTVTIDPDTGTVTLTGTTANISAVGAGLLVHDVGRIVRDLGTEDVLSLAGEWMILNNDTEKVCSHFDG
jgi:hypothetical protein